MQVLLIEPHPDDLLISAHEAVASLAQKAECTWVSMTNPREYANYPIQELGVKSAVSLLLSDDGKRKDAKMYYRKYMVEHSVLQACNHFIKNSLYAAWLKQATVDLVSILDSQQFDLILVPMGLKHVTHILTAMAFHFAFSKTGSAKVWYYAEHPYSEMVSGKYMKEDLIHTRGLTLVHSNSNRDTGNLTTLMKKYYPSEWMFANKGTFLPIEIYERV